MSFHISNLYRLQAVDGTIFEHFWSGSYKAIFENVMPPLKGSLSLNILAYRLYRLHVFAFLVSLLVGLFMYKMSPKFRTL